MSRKKIIIDCDPGQDDAVAIMVAGKKSYLGDFRYYSCCRKSNFR